jgi:transcriptional regulator with XRE-family HTH domain
MSQRTLSAAASVDQASISQIESGLINIQLITLIRISQALDVPLHTFFAE